MLTEKTRSVEKRCCSRTRKRSHTVINTERQRKDGIVINWK